MHAEMIKWLPGSRVEGRSTAWLRRALAGSVILCALGVFGPAWAANLSGNCTTSLGSVGCPYTVTGAVTVPAGATCTIPSSCTVTGQGKHGDGE